MGKFSIVKVLQRNGLVLETAGRILYPIEKIQNQLFTLT
jgi:hypothetical protein